MIIDLKKHQVKIINFSCHLTYGGLYEGTINTHLNENILLNLKKQLQKKNNTFFVEKPVNTENPLPMYECICELESVPQEGYEDEELRYVVLAFYSNCKINLSEEVSKVLNKYKWEDISDEYEL